MYTCIYIYIFIHNSTYIPTYLGLLAEELQVGLQVLLVGAELVDALEVVVAADDVERHAVASG